MLSNFFSICTWWIIPFLFLAWLLGWLFWQFLRRPKYTAEIDGLKSDNSGLRSKIGGLEGDLSSKVSAYNSLQGDYDGLNTRYSGMESNFYAEQKAKGEVETELEDWKSRYSTVETNWNTEKTNYANLQTKYDKDIKTERDVKIQVENNYSGLQTKFASLEKNYKVSTDKATKWEGDYNALNKKHESEMSNWNIKWGDFQKQAETDKIAAVKTEHDSWNIKWGDYTKKAEADKAAAVKAETDKWNIKWGDYTKKAEADKAAAVKAETDKWNIKWGDYTKKTEADKDAAVKAEASNWNIKWSNLNKEKEEASKAWNLKFTTLQKDKEDAGKAEANNWNIKFANYKKEAEAEKAAAVKAEADKVGSQWNIKWGDYQKKVEAEKEAAVKAEANQWNIKFGNYKKEADAAAGKELEAQKSQWNLKFTTLQKEKDAAVTGNNDEANKYKAKISTLEKDMKHLTADYETKLKSWNLKWTKLEGNYNKAKEEADAAKNNYKSMNLRFVSLEKEQKTAAKNASGNLTVINNYKVKIGDLEKKLKDAQAAAKSADANYRSLNLRFVNLDKQYKSTASSNESGLAKLKSQVGKLEADLKAAKTAKSSADANYKSLYAKFGGLEKNYKSASSAQANYKSSEAKYKARIKGLEGDVKNWRSQYKTAEGAGERRCLAAAKEYYGKVKMNDLTVVEGIGPKIQGLLRAAGIDTWHKLWKAEYKTLKKVLTDAGPRYQMHDPKTWSAQSKLAYFCQWARLKKWQDELDGGKGAKVVAKPAAKTVTKSVPKAKVVKKARTVKVKKAAPKVSADRQKEMLKGARVYWGRVKWDDHKIVEGIGPKIEKLLHGIGIRTWKKLSEAKYDTLKNMLTKAGPRYQMHDPKTWPLQASFAYTGQWKKLNDWQDKHSGGRKKGKVTKAKSTTRKATAKRSTTKAKSSGSSSAISATRKAELLGGAKNYYGRLKWDDHKVVEGIGPKIEGLLHGIGIKTWKQLSEAKYDTLKGMLTKAGPRYQMHDPKTWAKQAGMAYRGQWGKLKKWQDELDGGKGAGKKSSGSAKKAKSSSRSTGYSAEQKSKMLAGAKAAFGRIKWDDLKVVEGIGPKIEGLCHKIGIKTWQKLSETDAKVLKKMLNEAGPRYQMHDPGSWPKQAGMAAKGEWAKLKKWQDSHSGGRA